MITYAFETNAFSLQELIGLFGRAATWKMPLDPADWRDLVENTPVLVSAWNGPHLVGFARLLTDCVRWANVTDVVVDPEFRRQGIGTELVRQLIEHPRVSRVRTFFLGTENAHAFYERLGFERDGGGNWMLLVRRDSDAKLGLGKELAAVAVRGREGDDTLRFPGGNGRTLVGTLRNVGGDRIVLLAHGYTSNRHARGRFPRMADALAARGISSLAFDFGGCGESDDAVLTLDTQLEDLRAAMAFVKERGFQRMALLGHSLGSLVCLRAYLPELRTMVLTGALTGPMHYRWADLYSPDQLATLERTGRLVIPSDEGPRRETVVGAEMLTAFASVDPEELLRPIRRPVLMVLGDGDEEERLLLAHARNALPLLPAGSQLQVIAGAPHGFGGAWDQVIDIAAGWLDRKL